MFAATRLRYALALVASAGLAGCSLYADGSDSSDTTGTDPVSQCVHDVIADCYLNQLPADVCANNVLTQCNLGSGDPTDPACYDEVLRACLESGGDPMLCDLRATESCGGPSPGCDPNTDPTCTPGCQPGDPSCDPYNDCFQRTFDECLSMNGDPEQCRLYADQICGGTTPGCDPMVDPTCNPGGQPGDPSCDPGGDCFDRVFADCLAQTNDPMVCIDIATQTCGGGTPGCDPMTDPGCVPGCDPMTDPTCGGPSCYDQVFRDCLQQGLDPMTCDQEASAACGEPPPPPPCDPNDPMCGPPPGCDPADPMCVPPPSCDPSDPNCPQPPPPPPCMPGDPMCSYP